MYLVIIYFIINIIYTLIIKNVPFWEMFFVATGFYLRAITGSIFIEKKPTAIFYIVVFLSALLIVISKRIAELMNNEIFGRKVLKYYSRELLVSLAIVSVSLLIAAYIYLIFSPYFETSNIFIREIFNFSIFPFTIVMFAVLRGAIKGEGEQPELFYIRNRFIIFNCILWLLLFLIATHI